MAFFQSYWLVLFLLVAILAARGAMERWPIRPRGALLFGREACLFLAAYLVYFLVRGAAKEHVNDAFAHARALMATEQRLGLAWEHAIQQRALRVDALIDLANWTYIWLFWPVLAGVLVWLFLRHPGMYPLYRNAILLSGAMGLAIFLLFPVAPPRFIADAGFTDTVGTRSSVYQMLLPEGLANLYAAMPSLHAGWLLIVGVAIARHARSTHWRLIGLALPVLMFLSIVATANHYILDGVAGNALATLALVLAFGFGRLRESNLIRRSAANRERFAQPAS